MIWSWNLPKKKENLCWKTSLHILFVATLFILAVSHKQLNIVDSSMGNKWWHHLIQGDHTETSKNKARNRNMDRSQHPDGRWKNLDQINKKKKNRSCLAGLGISKLSHAFQVGLKLCSWGWPWTSDPPAPPPEYWGCRCVLPHLIHTVLRVGLRASQGFSHWSWAHSTFGAVCLVSPALQEEGM